jgi:hypothetical protein
VILGYKLNIEEDKKLIVANRGKFTSEPLKKMIEELTGS